MQAFAEANAARLRYAIRTVSTRDTITTHQGLTLANLEPLPDVDSRALVVVPGMPYRATERLDAKAVRWLRHAYEAGAMIASVCTGSFVLGEAGPPRWPGRTTHPSRGETPQRRLPPPPGLAHPPFASPPPP